MMQNMTLILNLMQYNLAPGNSSISDLPDDTLCSFYGSYQLQSAEVVDFEPVHCIMNRPPPTIPVPPTTTEDTTATSTSASESDTTGSVSQGKGVLAIQCTTLVNTKFGKMTLAWCVN